jgi:hypothetical protein
MKPTHLILSAVLASGSFFLLPSDAQANGYFVPPSPTLAVSIQATGFGRQTVSFTGSDYCGSAYEGVINLLNPRVSVTCGHTVFVGIWQPVPAPNFGGSWAQSVTLQSSAGGTNVLTSDVGLISGSFNVGCGGANGTLYAFDLDDQTLITGAAVNSLPCWFKI